MTTTTAQTVRLPHSLWELHDMAVDRIAERMRRITQALDKAGVSYAVIGGQAVAAWVSTIDPAAVRTTKDVDLLMDRADLPRASEAARAVKLDYFELMGVGMFLERDDPNPRHGVHLVWAGEKVRLDSVLPAPTIQERQRLESGTSVIALPALVKMKLTSFRTRDRVHLRDMIDVGLITRDAMDDLPPELAARLELVFAEPD